MEFDENKILERQAYNEILATVEYTLTTKGQELVESVIYLLNIVCLLSSSCNLFVITIS
jgi:DNA-binding HxlR family transcriptional regulator